MSNKDSKVEYVMRCKLPLSSSYHCSPSGDTEYEADYRSAIFANKPEGFEIHWQSQPYWPKDQDGMTWVRLYLTDKNKALEYWIDEAYKAKNKVDEMKEAMSKFV